MDKPRLWLDCETTRLDHDRKPWDVAGILRPAGGNRADDQEFQWFVDIADLDLATADLKSLEVGRFWTRHPQARLAVRMPRFADLDAELPATPPAGPVVRLSDLLSMLCDITEDAVVHGSNPAFDTGTLDPLFRAAGRDPRWYYHPDDVPGVARGWLLGRGHGDVPSKSDQVSLRCGIDPAGYDRHTALGDCRWLRDLTDLVEQPMHARVPSAVSGLAADIETVLNQKTGHAHTRPGIWDPDNRPGIANTVCVECAARARVRAWLDGQTSPEMAWPSAEETARRFLTTYRELAPRYGYEPAGTADWDDESSGPWALLVQTCGLMLTWLSEQVHTDQAALGAEPLMVPGLDWHGLRTTIEHAITARIRSAWAVFQEDVVYAEQVAAEAASAALSVPLLAQIAARTEPPVTPGAEAAEPRFSIAFNALSAALARVDRFVALSERKTVTAAVLAAIDAYRNGPARDPDAADAEALDRLVIGLANRGIFVSEETPLAVATTALARIDRLTTALDDAARDTLAGAELEAALDGLGVEQEIRARALPEAARLVEAMEHDGDTTIRDVEETTIGVADRLAEWIASGSYQWMADNPAQLQARLDAATSALTMAREEIHRRHAAGYQEAVRRLRDAPMAEASREGFAAYLNGIAPDPGASIPAPVEERADA